MGFDWLAPKNYKKHYICMSCQKGFKRPSEKDMKHPYSSNLSGLMDKYYQDHHQEDILQYLFKVYEKNKVVCPNCKGEMHQVDYNFEVPAHRDHKSWKRLQKTIVKNTETHLKVFIEWHRLHIKTLDALSDKHKLLLHNLKKLEKTAKAI